MADERLVDSMGVEAIPTTLFVGPDGKLVSRIVGAGHAGEITEQHQAIDRRRQRAGLARQARHQPPRRGYFGYQLIWNPAWVPQLAPAGIRIGPAGAGGHPQRCRWIQVRDAG